MLSVENYFYEFQKRMLILYRFREVFIKKEVEKSKKEEANTIIEQGTNYSFVARALQPLTFMSVKALSDQFILNLPQELQDRLFSELKRGVNLLESEPHLSGYLYAFGVVQEARFKKAFERLSKSFLGKEIEIVDYGCGQAVAEMVYHDFLQNKNLFQPIRKITLIDPSARCLQRAALHANLFYPQAEISTVCKYINDLSPEDIRTNEGLAKLHILSNVPNMTLPVIEHLTAVIKANLSGLNQFVCVGPFYGESTEYTSHLETFIKLMNAEPKSVFSENLQANQLVEGKIWTSSMRLFVKDGAKNGQIVVENKIKYWVSEDGVKYSEDRHKLIKCPLLLHGEYVMPATVTEIDDKAFRGCESLNCIMANNAVYKSQEGVLYSRDMTELIRYPIGKMDTHFVVPETVQAIAPYAFAGCKALQHVILPEMIRVIGYKAFEYCNQLKNITIPESVTRIEGNAFSMCSALTTLVFNATHCESMENTETDEFGVSSREALVFEGCSSLTTIHIGSNVTVIPDYAFSFCEGLYSLLLPDSVITIGLNAFSYCRQLESITLPASVKTIQREAFFWCKNLHFIFVPKGLKSHFQKYEFLKDYQSCIVEEGVENPENEKFMDQLPPLPRVSAAVAAAAEVIEEKPVESKTAVVPEVEFPESAEYANHMDNIPTETASDAVISETVIADAPPIEKIESPIEEAAAPPNTSYDFEAETKKIDETVAAPKTVIADVPPLKKVETPVEEATTPPNTSTYDFEAETKKIDEIIAALHEPDEPEAICRLREAAENGDMKAQNKLGYLYDIGKDVIQNDAESVRWYRRSAALGNAKAQYNLANHYASGRGVPLDHAEAARWYKMAADQGILQAMNNLGAIYATGKGVKRNENEAIIWYQRAASRGDETAIRNLRKRGMYV